MTCTCGHSRDQHDLDQACAERVIRKDKDGEFEDECPCWSFSPESDDLPYSLED